MKYQKRDIIFGLIHAILLTLVVLGMMYIFFLDLMHEISYTLVFSAVLDLACIVFLIFFWKNVLTTISQYRYAKETDVLSTLVGIKPYANMREMREAYDKEKPFPLYNDGKLIVTENFVEYRKKYKLFDIHGILDAKVITYRVNYSIEAVKVQLIYMDGERYTITYRSLTEKGRMKDRSQTMINAANIIASRSKNFRRHLPPAKTKH